MLEALDQHAEDMRHEEADGEVGQEFVEVCPGRYPSSSCNPSRTCRPARLGARPPDVKGSCGHRDVAKKGEPQSAGRSDRGIGGVERPPFRGRWPTRSSSASTSAQTCR